MSGGWGSNRSLAVGYLIIFTYLTGCAFLKPMPERQSLESRLKAFPVTGLPLRAKAEIHWDGHQIPFIQAADDRDLPFLIGMVHAHLRLAQMEVLRRASQGRLSEMMGPFTADIDHLIRTIDFARAMPEIRAGLPSETET